MTPQSDFMIVAPVRACRIKDLTALLESMTSRPGMADPKNSIVPFEKFEGLHYARFVILDDQTLDDLACFGMEVPKFPSTLAFLGDCDGPTEAFFEQLASGASAGLQKIFSYCEGFAQGTNLLEWMKEHSQPSSASYVNWIGRTVRQVHEEAALRKFLLQKLGANPTRDDDLQGFWQELAACVGAEQDAGRLTLHRPEPTPLAWRLSNFLNCVAPLLVAVVVVGILYLVCLLLIPLVLFVIGYLWLLRRYEKTEPEIVKRPLPDHGKMLARLEDHDVTNQFTVVGSVKPSLIRRVTLAVILYAIDYGARHVYNRGRLGRIQSIHFARWTYLDGGKRVLFASNYDGSLESYMDDFINKVGWGLNMVFSNGVGYPRTHWLISRGSKEEQKFKYTLRRHQVPTQVWYKAYPGLTAFDLARNTRIRKGIERKSMTDDEIRDWLRDL